MLKSRALQLKKTIRAQLSKPTRRRSGAAIKHANNERS